MSYEEIFVGVLTSALAGIMGGLGVHWFYRGVQLFDGEIRFGKGEFSRYFHKYLFIGCFLFFVSVLLSVIYLIFLRDWQSYYQALPKWIVIGSLISEIVIMLTFLFWWGKKKEDRWKNIFGKELV